MLLVIPGIEIRVMFCIHVGENHQQGRALFVSHTLPPELGPNENKSLLAEQGSRLICVHAANVH